MKEAVKIVTIGGGSSYTPELMEGFIKRYEDLPIREIWLVDIEDGKEKVEIVGGLAQRMWDASPYDVKVYTTLDRREALKDADFVTTQFRVGLLDARIKDERIPSLYGMLGQETNGAGGMLKAFRTIPVIGEIIRDMREGGTRAEQMKQTEKELFELYKNTELHTKPEQLSKRGGAYYSDAACECIRAIYANQKIHMVVSTQNNGAISCLDDDSIVEVSSIISAAGAQPMAFGKLPPAEKGWLQMMKAMEECTIQAALTGDYGMALEAFVLNPLVENNKDTQRVLDELLVAHEKYLPQFSEKIQELKAAGVHTEDPVVEDLMKHGR